MLSHDPYPSPVSPLPNITVSPKHLKAAAGFGKLLAMSLLEMEDCLPPLLDAAVAGGYTGSLSGLQTKFSWVLRDNALAWERKRYWAERNIQKRLAPMLGMRMPRASLLAAGHDENKALQGPLLGREVVGIIADEVAQFLRRDARTHRYTSGARRHG